MNVRPRTGAAVLVASLIALAIVLLAGGGTRAKAGSDYRVDVIFDSAKGVVSGQEVKIAGARVGRITGVSLTGDYKARISLDVDARFAPFRRDARCSLQPEGLIAERFVQCDPGTPGAGALTGHGDAPPTVPVTQTSLPVSLTDLFRILDTPSSQRLTVLLSSLGAGVSGRGQDLNAILLRANPTLGQLRRVLGTLGRQRGELRTAISATDRVVSALARQRGSVQAFITHAAGAGSQLAARRADLTAAVDRLPDLLSSARPALRKLDATASALTPVLADVRSAAAPLDDALVALPPFAAKAQPALKRIGAASQRALKSTRAVAATSRLLRRFAVLALPTGRSLDRTLVSLRDTGTVEGLLSFAYNAGAVLALHDDISHIGPSLLGPTICFVDVNQGCASETPKEGQRSKPTGKRGHTSPAPSASAPTAAPGAPSAPAAEPAPTIKLPGLPPITLPIGGSGSGGDKPGVGERVKDLLQELLG